jgi:nitrogen-specific signal transduction histidine kinase
LNSSPVLNHESVLDAIPLVTFVVDDDMAVQYANATALRFFRSETADVIRRRGGEILHCMHAQETPGGCGRAPSCRDCVIRNTVKACLAGREVKRSRLKLQLVTGESATDIELLISASVLDQEQRLTVLILEDISEISTLRQIVSICAHCRRLRNAQQEWQSVEAFFKHEVGLDFSHSICPECLQTHFSSYCLGGQDKQIT